MDKENHGLAPASTIPTKRILENNLPHVSQAGHGQAPLTAVHHNEMAENNEDDDIEGYFSKLVASYDASASLKTAFLAEFRKSKLAQKLELIREVENMVSESKAESQAHEQPCHEHPSRTTTEYVAPPSAKQERPSAMKQLQIEEEEIDTKAVDEAFHKLIQESLDESKGQVLLDSYNALPNYTRKYHMLLEFTSYLKQPDATVEGEMKEAQSSLRRRAGRSSKAHSNPVAAEDDEWLQKYGNKGAREEPFEYSPLLIAFVLVVGFVVVRQIPAILWGDEWDGDGDGY